MSSKSEYEPRVDRRLHENTLEDSLSETRTLKSPVYEPKLGKLGTKPHRSQGSFKENDGDLSRTRSVKNTEKEPKSDSRSKLLNKSPDRIKEYNDYLSERQDKRITESDEKTKLRSRDGLREHNDILSESRTFDIPEYDSKKLNSDSKTHARKSPREYGNSLMDTRTLKSPEERLRVTKMLQFEKGDDEKKSLRKLDQLLETTSAEFEKMTNRDPKSRTAMETRKYSEDRKTPESRKSPDSRKSPEGRKSSDGRKSPERQKSLENRKSPTKGRNSPEGRKSPSTKSDKEFDGRLSGLGRDKDEIRKRDAKTPDNIKEYDEKRTKTRSKTPDTEERGNIHKSGELTANSTEPRSLKTLNKDGVNFRDSFGDVGSSKEIRTKSKSNLQRDEDTKMRKSPDDLSRSRSLKTPEKNERDDRDAKSRNTKRIESPEDLKEHKKPSKTIENDPESKSSKKLFGGRSSKSPRNERKLNEKEKSMDSNPDRSTKSPDYEKRTKNEQKLNEKKKSIDRSSKSPDYEKIINKDRKKGIKSPDYLEELNTILSEKNSSKKPNNNLSEKGSSKSPRPSSGNKKDNRYDNDSERRDVEEHFMGSKNIIRSSTPKSKQTLNTEKEKQTYVDGNKKLNKDDNKLKEKDKNKYNIKDTDKKGDKRDVYSRSESRSSPDSGKYSSESDDSGSDHKSAKISFNLLEAKREGYKNIKETSKDKEVKSKDKQLHSILSPKHSTLTPKRKSSEEEFDTFDTFDSVNDEESVDDIFFKQNQNSKGRLQRQLHFETEKEKKSSSDKKKDEINGSGSKGSRKKMDQLGKSLSKINLQEAQSVDDSAVPAKKENSTSLQSKRKPHSARNIRNISPSSSSATKDKSSPRIKPPSPRSTPIKQSSPRSTPIKRSSPLSTPIRKSSPSTSRLENYSRSDTYTVPSNSSDLKEMVYRQWLEKKTLQTKEEIKAKMAAQKKAMEESEAEATERKIVAKKTFEAWNDSKTEQNLTEKEKKQKVKQAEKEKLEEAIQQKKNAEKYYETWKRDKDVKSKKSHSQKKHEEVKKEKETFREKQKTHTEALKAFECWKSKKDEEVVKSKKQQDEEKAKLGKEKIMEFERKQEALRVYEEWKNNSLKKSPRSVSPQLTQRSWCPAGRNLKSAIPGDVQPVIVRNRNVVSR